MACRERERSYGYISRDITKNKYNAIALCSPLLAINILIFLKVEGLKKESKGEEERDMLVRVEKKMQELARGKTTKNWGGGGGTGPQLNWLVDVHLSPNWVQFDNKNLLLEEVHSHRNDTIQSSSLLNISESVIKIYKIHHNLTFLLRKKSTGSRTTLNWLCEDLLELHKSVQTSVWHVNKMDEWSGTDLLTDLPLFWWVAVGR